MIDSMDDSSTIEETEVNSEFEEVLESFNEMHEEAQRLVVSNNKLRSDLKLHITKLALTQSKLDYWDKKMKNLFQAIKPLIVFMHLLLLMDDYKSFQIEFENFKKDHHKEHMKRQIELSYLKYLCHLLSV